MSENKNMITCPTCGEEIAKSAKVCPKCGAKMKKPWYKKWWVWVIIVIVIGAIGGSGSKNKSESTSTDSSADVPVVSQNQSTEQPVPAVEGSDSSAQQTEAAPADNQLDAVLWESSGVKITYKGIEEDFMGTDIKILVENSSGSNYLVTLESIDINGFTMSSSTSLYTEVSAGKKVNDSISIFSSGLEENGINGKGDIDEIELAFKVTDTSTYNSVTSDIIKLTY